MSVILGEIESALHEVMPEVITILKELVGFPGKVFKATANPSNKYRKNFYNQEQQPEDYNTPPFYEGNLVLSDVITDRYYSPHSEIDPYNKELIIYDVLRFPDDAKIEIEYSNKLWSFRIKRVEFHGLVTGEAIVYKHILIPFNKVGRM